MIHALRMGGMENGLVNLINRLPAHEFSHAVLCAEDHDGFRDRIRRDDVEVVALHRSRIGAMAMRRQIVRYLKQRRPAILHSRNLSGLDALAPAWWAGVPVRIHSEHGWDADNLRGERLKPLLLRRLHAPLVHHYVAVSADLQRFLVERVGVAPARVSHICNGVDTDRFRPAAEGEPPAAPAGLGDPGLWCVGAVGRVQAVKDQATLLRAAARLLEQAPALRPRLRVAVVGDGPLLGDLRALGAQLGIQENLLLPGASGDVPAWMRRLDVFVLPSLNEGISNTLLEAMACGVPVLATAVGGNPELVTEGVDGGLFTPGDVEWLAERLLAYAHDPALCRLHGAAARRSALDRFSLEAMVSGYRALYHNLMHSGPAAGG